MDSKRWFEEHLKRGWRRAGVLGRGERRIVTVVDRYISISGARNRKRLVVREGWREKHADWDSNGERAKDTHTFC